MPCILSRTYIFSTYRRQATSSFVTYYDITTVLRRHLTTTTTTTRVVHRHLAPSLSSPLARSRIHPLSPHPHDNHTQTRTMAIFSSIGGVLGYETLPEGVKSKSFYDLKTALPGKDKVYDFVSGQGRGRSLATRAFEWIAGLQHADAMARGDSAKSWRMLTISERAEGKARLDSQHREQVVSPSHDSSGRTTRCRSVIPTRRDPIATSLRLPGPVPGL